MLWKFVLVASLALGACGRSTSDVPDSSPDETSQQIAMAFCNATHAVDKTPEVKVAIMTFKKCMDDAFSIDTFTDEFKKAESSGVYDQVIPKYCTKAPEVKECASNLVKGMSPCLPAGLKRTAVKTINTMLNFVCDNNGARITTFIKEGGPRCIKDSMFYIIYCQEAVKTNLTKLTNLNVTEDLIASLLTISDKERCFLLDQSLECLENAIKGCNKPVLAKMSQEFHRIHLESMSCVEVTTEVVTETAGTVDTTGSKDAGVSVSTLKVPENSPYGQTSKLVATEFCNATHATEKTPEVELAIITFAKCFNELIDIKTFTKEIKEEENSGVYGQVSQKYCAKAPQLKECNSDLVKVMAPCLPVGLDRIALRSTNTLIDFVCDNNGARLTRFVKEGGPRCIENMMFYITYCQSNLTNLLNKSGEITVSSVFDMPDKDKCAVVDYSLECLLTAMKSCQNPALGQLGQEIHDVYLESLSCSEVHANTEVVAGTTRKVDISTGRTDASKDIDQLKKKKLEIEVRTAELEIWNRENELNVEHTDLTADIKTKGR